MFWPFFTMEEKIIFENKLKYISLFQRIFLFLSLLAKFPATLNIEPTNFCNLNCSFCPTRKTNRQFGFMEFSLYKKIIDDIFPRKLKVLWLNKDGEPLLHQEITKMVKYAKEKRVARRVEIYTNGVFLTEKMSKDLIMASLDSLVISLDAINKEEFKKIKRKDSYETVVNNIYKFLDVRKKLGAKNPVLSVKMVDLRDKKMVEEFKKRWSGVADNVIIQPLHNWEGSIKIKNKKENIKKENKRYPCNLPWLSAAVFWDGKVTPCCVNYKVNELIMGDLKKQSLKEIWQGEKFRKLRQAHLSQDFSDFPTCKNCLYWQQLPSMEWWLKILN